MVLSGECTASEGSYSGDKRDKGKDTVSSLEYETRLHAKTSGVNQWQSKKKKKEKKEEKKVLAYSTKHSHLSSSMGAGKSNSQFRFIRF